MKTIAIIESCDTKYTETAYMKECIEKAGLQALVLNTATGPEECANPDDNGKVVDVSRNEIVAAYGTPWSELEDKTTVPCHFLQTKLELLSLEDLEIIVKYGLRSLFGIKCARW